MKWENKTIKANGKTLKDVKDCRIEGDNNTIKDCKGCFIQGNKNEIYASECEIHGNENLIHSENCEIHGNENKVYGDKNKIFGTKNKAYGNKNIAQGKQNTTFGDFCILLVPTDNSDPNLNHSQEKENYSQVREKLSNLFGKLVSALSTEPIKVQKDNQEIVEVKDEDTVEGSSVNLFVEMEDCEKPKSDADQVSSQQDIATD